MSTHPHIANVDRMTTAIFDNDRKTLDEVFADDVAFHVRGPLPAPGDYTGVDGVLSAIGGIVERTAGDVKIEQLCCLANDEWATEWEHAVFGRNGATLEADNAFVYRFRDNRIAEMWMICTAPTGAETFWD